MTTIMDTHPHLIKVVSGKSSNPALGDCWEWGGTRTPDGYGKVTIGGVKYLAHRVALALAFGELPSGKMGLHQCDNPPCVRVEGPGGVNHLKPGTRSDNMADAWAKGRLGPHTRGVRKAR